MLALALATGLGYLARDLAPRFPRDAQVAAFVFTMFCIGLTVTRAALWQALGNWRAMVVSLGFSYGVAPLLAALLGRALLLPGSVLHQGFILVGCTATTISSAIVYARAAGGNGALGLVLSNGNGLSSTLLTPLLCGLLLSARVDVPVGPMARLLCVGVLVPVLAAQVLVLVRPSLSARLSRPASTASQYGIVVVVFLGMTRAFAAAGPDFYAALPGTLLRLVAGSVALYGALSLGAFAVARRAGVQPADAVTVAYISGQKTLAATAVLADRFFSPMAAVPILVYHLVQLLCGTLDARYYRLRAGRDTPPVT